MTGSHDSSTRERQRLGLIRQTVTQLNELLTMLYPESPSPDVITLRDFLIRYRLTGLGAPAVQAIEQTQRINRALNNYRQIGLSEFHIGLFYLHWGECHGGIRQFARARQQWSFIDAAAPLCLAHFAEGRAHHIAYEYEVAMHHYGRAAQWLARIQFTPPSENQNEFIKQMTDQLQEWQARLRDDMLPDFKVEEPLPSAPGEERAAPGTGARAGEAEEKTPPEPEEVPLVPPIPLPISNLDAGSTQLDTPVPAHVKVNDSHAWYEVSTEDAAFLPDVVQGSWVLVDTDTAQHKFEENELIVILRNQATNASIVLKPLTSGQPFQRIYLGSLRRLTGGFTRAEGTGTVALSPEMEQRVTLEEILGIVIGFWLPWPRPVMGND